jgi:hypothetical protein
MMHPTKTVFLGCTDCHGGNSSVTVARGDAQDSPEYDAAKERAHVQAHDAGFKDRSALPERTYTKWLGESPEYIKFVNPGDLRAASETCGATGCHAKEVRASSTSMMTHTGLLWGAALYNNGGYPTKNTRFGESYDRDGNPQSIKTFLPPTPEETRTKGVLPELDPLLRWEISQPGNVLRVFERGGQKKAELGNPNREEDPGKPEDKLSDRGFGTELRTDPVFLGLQKTRLVDPVMSLPGTNDHPGDYRASGCTACHVIYANDQRSMSEEKKEWEIVQTADSITPGNVHFNMKSFRAKLMTKDGFVASQMPQDDDHLAHANSSMTCYSCHTSWTPTCFGCHLQMTVNARKPMLHNEGLTTRNYTSYNFQVLCDDIYMLGVDGTVTGHRIAPARSSCAILVSSQNANRDWLYYTQQTISTPGFSGQAFSTFVPHTVRAKETKQCSDCHVSAANDNNAWMAQLLLQGTNFMNFMGRYVYVATGKKGLEAVAIAEHDEPEAIYGSASSASPIPTTTKSSSSITTNSPLRSATKVTSSTFRPAENMRTPQPAPAVSTSTTSPTSTTKASPSALPPRPSLPLVNASSCQRKMPSPWPRQLL